MTSRERILQALHHQETDRIPIDFSGHRSSGISAIAYPKLRRALGLPATVPKVYDVIQQLAIVEEDVLLRFGVDTVELGRGFALQPGDWVDWILPDGSPGLVPHWCLPERVANRWVIRSRSGRIIAHMPEGAYFFEQCGYPFQDGVEDLNDIPGAFAESMWTAIASPPDPVDTDALRSGAIKLRKTSARAIIGLFGGNLLECGQFLYRNDHFLAMLAGEPRRAHAFLDRLVELHLANLQQFLSTVGDCIDIIAFGDDLGMQSGPQMSPRMYREFFKQRHAILWNRAKQLANVKVMLHCCGGVRSILRDLIEAGLDAINPVQITCRGMDSVELKKEFGQDITFWGGGCDTRIILPASNPTEVADHVRRQVSIWRTGGGFVFQQVHNILADVPPENITAMFDAINSG